MDGVKEVDVDKRLEFWTEGIVEDTRDELTVEEDEVTMVDLVIEWALLETEISLKFSLKEGVEIKVDMLVENNVAGTRVVLSVEMIAVETVLTYLLEEIVVVNRLEL